jgi:hypothetical protein
MSECKAMLGQVKKLSVQTLIYSIPWLLFRYSSSELGGTEMGGTHMNVLLTSLSKIVVNLEGEALMDVYKPTNRSRF